jgi:hypothetical protein
MWEERKPAIDKMKANLQKKRQEFEFNVPNIEFNVTKPEVLNKMQDSIQKKREEFDFNVPNIDFNVPKPEVLSKMQDLMLELKLRRSEGTNGEGRPNPDAEPGEGKEIDHEIARRRISAAFSMTMRFIRKLKESQRHLAQNLQLELPVVLYRATALLLRQLQDTAQQSAASYFNIANTSGGNPLPSKRVMESVVPDSDLLHLIAWGPAYTYCTGTVSAGVYAAM